MIITVRVEVVTNVYRHLDVLYAVLYHSYKSRLTQVEVFIFILILKMRTYRHRLSKKFSQITGFMSCYQDTHLCRPGVQALALFHEPYEFMTPFNSLSMSHVPEGFVLKTLFQKL